MIRGGFLDPAIRADLIGLVRDGKAETRLTRRANALLLLDDGMSCAAIAKKCARFCQSTAFWSTSLNGPPIADVPDPAPPKFPVA